MRRGYLDENRMLLGTWLDVEGAAGEQLGSCRLFMLCPHGLALWRCCTALNTEGSASVRGPPEPSVLG